MRYSIVFTFLLISESVIGQSTDNKIETKGNIGIGTLDPKNKLEVVGRTALRGDLYIMGDEFVQFVQGKDSDKRGVSIGVNDFGLKTRYRRWSGGSRAYNQVWYDQGGSDFFFGGSTLPIFSISNKGVGVGTKEITHNLSINGSGKFMGAESSYTEINSNNSGPFMSQYGKGGTSLSWIIRGYANNNLQAEFNMGGVLVNGKVQAEEVNISLDGWADYVFTDGYSLMSLGELKSFIDKNGHLPGIPIEAVVKKEGLNLGEINAKLLEKIEELTLYVIYQEEQIQELLKLQKEVEQLKEAVATQ
ncbi:hypothetical protein [Cyclobacterium marinum]|uniref:Peptidase S74 domain-containing protein n=1 Tax=Cyclobacterium marinum (strain ATCC 25205 / DSM 745 / LMG 13164 / NCIMB 1802) TaxID=880070 RepID=G0IYJ8_CYCMS|nr:hypothetical protein [Cyclobacterium marinum]AEL26421.1 hypothetical protein Cycma_2682 [Cyclobacterium marinum DSM 745]MBI0399758.1 hypothetical protein [Cyclobacterium marinum]